MIICIRRPDAVSIIIDRVLALTYLGSLAKAYICSCSLVWHMPWISTMPPNLWKPSKSFKDFCGIRYNMPKTQLQVHMTQKKLIALATNLNTVSMVLNSKFIVSVQCYTFVSERVQLFRMLPWIALWQFSTKLRHSFSCGKCSVDWWLFTD